MIIQQNIMHVTANNQTGQTNQSGGKQKSFFAGNMPQDKVLEKQLKARKRAMKMIEKAFATERKVDQDLANREDKVTSLNKQLTKNTDKLKELDEISKQLKEAYRISDDSKEQKDLEVLIEKHHRKSFGDTKAFNDYIRNLKAEGATQYQIDSIMNEEGRKKYIEDNKVIDREIRTENLIIATTKMERLKHRPIMEATEDAEKILEAASNDIKSQLYDEAKEHIKEEEKENEKRGEKLAEEQKEKAEFIERIKGNEDDKKDDNEYIKAVTKHLVSLENTYNSIQGEVKRMIHKMNIIEDDVKGVKVDKKVT